MLSNMTTRRRCCDEKQENGGGARELQCFPRSGTRERRCRPIQGHPRAEVIKALDREHLTLREAHSRTGIAAADFSRVRNGDLGRFTVDRLISIINRLGSRVEAKIRVQPAETAVVNSRSFV